MYFLRSELSPTSLSSVPKVKLSNIGFANCQGLSSALDAWRKLLKWLSLTPVVGVLKMRMATCRWRSRSYKRCDIEWRNESERQLRRTWGQFWASTLHRKLYILWWFMIWVVSCKRFFKCLLYLATSPQRDWSEKCYYTTLNSTVTDACLPSS